MASDQSYSIYCAWCRDHSQPVPTREWWDFACAKREIAERISQSDFDISTERREGWAYDR